MRKFEETLNSFLQYMSLFSFQIGDYDRAQRGREKEKIALAGDSRSSRNVHGFFKNLGNPAYSVISVYSAADSHDTDNARACGINYGISNYFGSFLIN